MFIFVPEIHIINAFPLEINNLSEIKSLLDRSENIVVSTHTNPDGDAIGSSLALYHYLRGIGKKAFMIVPNDYPEFISWLPGNDEIIVFGRNYKAAKAAFDRAELVFCLDYNAIHRSGMVQDVLRECKAPRIMIDHHPKPVEEDFDHLVSTTDTSSTAELLYEVLIAVDEQFSPDTSIATALYVGIMTDTGSFSFACNRPRTFEVTASLLESGIDGEYIHRMVYDTFSEDRLRLLGYSLAEKLVVKMEYATAYIYLTARDLQRFNYKVGDTEGLVNYALSIKGINMAVLLTQRKDRIRLSFRSKGEFSVNEIAAKHFQGGGHRNAAGGDSYETMEKTLARLEGLLPEYKSRLLEPGNA